MHGRKVAPTAPPVRSFEVTAPAGLSKTARAYWDALAPELVERGWLTTADAALFGDLCEARASIDAAWKNIEVNGPIVAGSHGQQARNPAYMIVSALQPFVITLSRFFGVAGMDSRDHLAVAPGPEQEDDLLDKPTFY